MRSSWLVLVVAGVSAMGCATGSPIGHRADGGRDASADLDATADDGGLDAATEDVGTDAASTDDAAAPIDAFVPFDAGPVACTSATAGAVCSGRPCVDGFCCDAPCDGACRSCSVAGSEGTCTLHASGSDPGDECAAQAPATCGTVGTCDGAGACALHPSTVSCDDGMACTASDTCDGAGTCRGTAPASCAPAAGNECCLGSCGGAGCTTSAGACADVCGAVQLSIGRTCMGCGAAHAAGACLGGAIHQCDATSHLLCEQISCGGMPYYCTQAAGVWSWRVATACDDGNACTYGDVCGAGTCAGATVTCTSTTCMTRSCNGTASCSDSPRTGVSCDDGNACTYGDACSSAGVCAAGTTVSCVGSACIDRACNGTATCTQTVRTGASCDDGAACTFGETCSAAGVCGMSSPVTCPADTTCRAYACNGTSTCAASPRNVGGACDDGDPATMADTCRADGTCSGSICSPTLVSVFTDAFAMPSSTAWTNGTNVVVNTSRWSATTSSQHGVRISGGLLEITNARGSSSPGHGQGFAMVRTGGVGSAYDNTRYQPILRANTGQSVVWSLNMHRDDPEVTDGGFSCSSSASQNDITVGLAYVLGATTAAGMQADASTCSATATSSGYAVVMGGSSRHVRLVRFENGLRNGTITNIVQSPSFGASSYFSVRVTYDAVNDLWTLEARSDGTSSFANPAAGTYSFTGTGTDAVHVTESLDYSGPYFQSGCSGLCSSTYTARFDNVSVGVRCAP